MKHHIRSIIFSGLLMISSEVSAFTTSRTFGTSPSCSVVLNAEKTEFGEITEDLPELDKSWVVAAQQSLSWEKRSNNDDTSAWSNGQYWYFTRTSLRELWILPQDMSKGSWDNYAEAASKGEEKVLQQVPQLFRLQPTTVIDSAKTVLNNLQLPPALLRKEPILLAMDSERLIGGFDTIRKVLNDPIEACRDTPNLLAKACMKWTPTAVDDTTTDDGNMMKNGDESGTKSISSVDNIQLLQKSFDNEVSADDLHMEPFLKDDKDTNKVEIQVNFAGAEAEFYTELRDNINTNLNASRDDNRDTLAR